MKTSIPLSAILLATALCQPLRAEDQPPGFVDLGKFAPPAGGGQFVEVNVKSSLLNLAARLVEKQEPDVATLVRDLKSIRVNVVGVDAGNRADLEERVRRIRTTLDEAGWERVVTVQEKDEDIGVYLKTRGDEAIDGIVVTVIEGGKEAIFVNVVGDIRPEKLAILGERLNIEPLKKAGKAASKG